MEDCTPSDPVLVKYLGIDDDNVFRETAFPGETTLGEVANIDDGSIYLNLRFEGVQYLKKLEYARDYDDKDEYCTEFYFSLYPLNAHLPKDAPVADEVLIAIIDRLAQALWGQRQAFMDLLGSEELGIIWDGPSRPPDMKSSNEVSYYLDEVISSLVVKQRFKKDRRDRSITLSTLRKQAYGLDHIIDEVIEEVKKG